MKIREANLQFRRYYVATADIPSIGAVAFTALSTLCAITPSYGWDITSTNPGPVASSDFLAVVFTVVGDDRDSSKLVVSNPVSDMTFTRMTSHKCLLRWTIPEDFNEFFLVNITEEEGTLGHEPAKLEFPIVPRSETPLQNGGAEQPRITTGTYLSSSARSERHALPVLPTSIVSAGNKVEINVSANEDEQATVLSVDWLPENARLVTKSNGSHTFIWQTSALDVGMHSFVFTDQDKSNPEFKDSTAATAVIDGSAVTVLGEAFSSSSSIVEQIPDDLEFPEAQDSISSTAPGSYTERSGSELNEAPTSESSKNGPSSYRKLLRTGTLIPSPDS